MQSHTTTHKHMPHTVTHEHRLYRPLRTSRSFRSSTDQNTARNVTHRPIHTSLTLLQHSTKHNHTKQHTNAPQIDPHTLPDLIYSMSKTKQNNWVVTVVLTAVKLTVVGAYMGKNPQSKYNIQGSPTMLGLVQIRTGVTNVVSAGNY